ncbi:MAG TPA: hypothetical protein VG247_16085 [Pseudonocardiaceae bacterium]|jgi:hypothetical protein|nr:hypothetical protein [Pseudonocardiaceae bacterium]
MAPKLTTGLHAKLIADVCRKCEDWAVRTWDELSHEEQCLMVNAREHDLLPGTLHDWRTDLDQGAQLALVSELADALVSLVDLGFVEVRRIVPGRDDGDTVPRADLPAVLADTEVWDYSERGWDYRDDGLCIVVTARGQELMGTDRSGVPNPQASNPYLIIR